MGNFRLIGDWLGYVSIIELSLSTIFLAELRRILHQNDKSEGLKRLMTVGMKSYAKGLICVWIVCLLLYYPFYQSSKIPDYLFWDTTFAYFLVSSAFIFMPLTPCRLYLELIERTDLVNYLMSLQNLMIIGLSLLFAYQKFGLSGQALAFCLGCSFSYYYIWKIFKTKTKELQLNLKTIFFIRKEERETNIWLQSFRKKLKDSFLLNIFHRLSLYSSNIIVAAFFSAKDIVPFMLTQRLSQIALDQTTNVGNSAWASVVSKVDKKNEEEAEAIFQIRFYEVTKIICLTSAAFSVPIIIWNGDFMTIWIGGQYYAGPLITVLACFLSLSSSLVSFWRQILTALGKISEQVWPTFIQALISLLSSILFTKYYGLVGPLMGLTFTFLAFHCWQFFYLFKKHLNLSIISLMLKIFPTILFTAIFSFGCYKIKHEFNLSLTWTNLALQVSVSFSLFIVGGYFFLLSSAEKKIWSERLLRLRSKQKA